MANTYILNTAKFDPLSFDDMMKPVKYYQDFYEKKEAERQAMEDVALSLDDRIQEADDAEMYKLYNPFKEDLQNAADQMSLFGYNRDIGSKLMGLRGRMNTDIKPLMNAFERWDKDKKTWDEMMAKDESLIGTNPYGWKPGQYLHNSAQQIQGVSGDKAAARVENMAKNLTRQLFDPKDPNNKSGWHNILGGQYYERWLQKGLTADQILQTILDPSSEEGNAFLQEIVKQAANGQDLSFLTDEQYEQYLTAASRGLWAAIGEASDKQLENWGAKIAAQSRASGGGTGTETYDTPYLDIRNWTVPLVDEHLKTIANINKKYKNKYSGLYNTDEDGNITTIKEDATREYYNKLKANVTEFGTFKNFAKKNNTYKTVYSGTPASGDAEETLSPEDIADAIVRKVIINDDGTINDLDQMIGTDAAYINAFNSLSQEQRKTILEQAKDYDFMKLVEDSGGIDDFVNTINSDILQNDLNAKKNAYYFIRGLGVQDEIYGQLISFDPQEHGFVEAQATRTGWKKKKGGNRIDVGEINKDDIVGMYVGPYVDQAILEIKDSNDKNKRKRYIVDTPTVKGRTGLKYFSEMRGILDNLRTERVKDPISGGYMTKYHYKQKNTTTGKEEEIELTPEEVEFLNEQLNNYAQFGVNWFLNQFVGYKIEPSKLKEYTKSQSFTFERNK